MLINPDKFHQLFSFIRDDASSGSCSVVIFVGPDADSVCGCKILTVTRNIFPLIIPQISSDFKYIFLFL